MCDERNLYIQNVRYGLDKTNKTISSYNYNVIVRKNNADIDKTVDSLLDDIDSMLAELKG